MQTYSFEQVQAAIRDERRLELGDDDSPNVDVELDDEDDDIFDFIPSSE